jgi:cell division protein FtsQ
MMESRRPEPNARNRIAERRRNLRQNERRQGGSAVQPGPRRTLDSWATSGRILSFPLFVLTIAGLIYIATSSRFLVRDVQVEGNKLLRSSTVARLSGVVGQSIWLANPETISSNIRSNAYVEQVSAELSLPDRLIIRIQERQPEVRWQSGGQLLLVDLDGRVLGPDSSGTISNTLIIEDRSGIPLEPNDRIDAEALSLGQELSLRLPNEVGLRPERFAWGVDTGILVEVAGRTIIFGTGDNLERKLVILQQLTNEATEYTFLDLRPETPYYRQSAPASAPTNPEP